MRMPRAKIAAFATANDLAGTRSRERNDGCEDDGGGEAIRKTEEGPPFACAKRGTFP